MSKNMTNQASECDNCFVLFKSSMSLCLNPESPCYLYHCGEYPGTGQDHTKRILEKIEEQAMYYERGEMLRADSEVEISLLGDEIWICDYSESRGDAVEVEKVCNIDEMHDYKEGLIAICNSHHWAYCL